MFVSGLEQLPASLEGTSVPPGLLEDASGNLVPTPGLRDIFDYFLSVQGEESLDLVVARIRAYLTANLSTTASAQAIGLLDRYLAFRDDLADIEQAGGTPANRIDPLAIQAQQNEVQALRQRYFDATVNEAFFAREDALNQYALARMQVLQDDSLSPAQQATRIDALRRELPPAMQEELDAVSRYQDLRTLTHDWREQGGSDAALRQIREQTVGAEAADRLEALERERAMFDQRVQQWLGERDTILANTSLSDSDRATLISHRRNTLFTDTERLRVETLERIHDSQRG